MSAFGSMGRLFEFSDQAWLPRLFRDLLTELLQHQLVTYRVYAPAIPMLNEAMRRAGSTEILDLGSGSGGPLLQLWPHLEASQLVMSDRFPNRQTIEEVDGLPGVTYRGDPVDARCVAADGRACRTLFTSFHHFGREDARRILESAVHARAPIAVFECTERARARGVTALIAPLSVLRDTWRMRPLRWSRLFWTYIVPVVPLIYTWDALVSHWRSYGPDELEALTVGLPGYEWRAGLLPPKPAPAHVTYLIGVPAA